MQVDIDRDRAAALGVTADQIESALFTAYGARQVSTIYAPSDQYAVIMELLPAVPARPERAGLLHVRGSSGALVPLDSVARLRTVTGPLTISHVGQLPSATISFNLAPGKSLGDAVASVERAQIRARRAADSCSAGFRAPRRPSNPRSAAWACCCCSRS